MRKANSSSACARVHAGYMEHGREGHGAWRGSYVSVNARRCVIPLRRPLKPIFGLAVTFELCEKQGAPAMQAYLYSVEAQSENPGDLPVGHFFELA